MSCFIDDIEVAFHKGIAQAWCREPATPPKPVVDVAKFVKNDAFVSVAVTIDAATILGAQIDDLLAGRAWPSLHGNRLDGSRSPNVECWVLQSVFLFDRCA